MNTKIIFFIALVFSACFISCASSKGFSVSQEDRIINVESENSSTKIRIAYSDEGEILSMSVHDDAQDFVFLINVYENNDVSYQLKTGEYMEIVNTNLGASAGAMVSRNTVIGKKSILEKIQKDFQIEIEKGDLP